MTILTSNKAISAAIKDLLRVQTRRRVVLSGFLGIGAEKLIPEPNGVEVYCWDREGATNPEAVRALLQQGAKVFFVSGLHAKVYWADGSGCVIGSANLSQNGLGEDGLHEVAVRLPRRSFNINGYLRTLEAIPVRESLLNAFELRCRKYRGRNNGRELLSPSVGGKRFRYGTPTFAEWMTMEYKMPWRLEVADTFFTDQEEREIVHRGALTEEDLESDLSYWTGEKGMTTPGRWVLFAEVRGKGRIFETEWSCPDEHFPSGRLGPRLKQEVAPWFAIQRFESKHYGPRPFRADEPRFRRALKRFLKERHAMDYEGACALAPNGKLGPANLRALLKRYTDEAT